MRIHNSLILTLIIVTGTCFLVAGCNKDKYTTKPQLTFKSVNKYNVERGDVFQFNIEFRDKEGDISDTLYMQNRTANCPGSDYTTPVAYKIPEFPTSANVKGNFTIAFENGTNNTGNVIYTGNSCQKPDTTIFYFWVKDKANNVSDTVHTDKPVIIQN